MEDWPRLAIVYTSRCLEFDSTQFSEFYIDFSVSQLTPVFKGKDWGCYQNFLAFFRIFQERVILYIGYFPSHLSGNTGLFLQFLLRIQWLQNANAWFWNTLLFLQRVDYIKTWSVGPPPPVAPVSAPPTTTSTPIAMVSVSWMSTSSTSAHTIQSVMHWSSAAPTTATRIWRWDSNVNVVSDDESCLAQRFVIVHSFSSGNGRSDVSGNVVTIVSILRQLSAARSGWNDGKFKVSAFFASVGVDFTNQACEFTQGGIHPGVDLQFIGRNFACKISKKKTINKSSKGLKGYSKALQDCRTSFNCKTQWCLDWFSHPDVP